MSIFSPTRIDWNLMVECKNFNLVGGPDSLGSQAQVILWAVNDFIQNNTLDKLNQLHPLESNYPSWLLMLAVAPKKTRDILIPKVLTSPLYKREDEWILNSNNKYRLETFLQKYLPEVTKNADVIALIVMARASQGNWLVTTHLQKFMPLGYDQMFLKTTVEEESWLVKGFDDDKFIFIENYQRDDLFFSSVQQWKEQILLRAERERPGVKAGVKKEVSTTVWGLSRTQRVTQLGHTTMIDPPKEVRSLSNKEKLRKLLSLISVEGETFFQNLGRRSQSELKTEIHNWFLNFSLEKQPTSNSGSYSSDLKDLNSQEIFSKSEVVMLCLLIRKLKKVDFVPWRKYIDPWTFVIQRSADQIPLEYVEEALEGLTQYYEGQKKIRTLFGSSEEINNRYHHLLTKITSRARVLWMAKPQSRLKGIFN